MRVIQRITLMAVVALALLFVSGTGCAYRLKYTVQMSVEPRGNGELFEKTFALERTRKKGKTGYRTESSLLNVLSRSLEQAGWTRTSDTEASYVFTVEFERPEPVIYPEIAFTANPGRGSGVAAGSIFDTRRDDTSHRIKITATLNSPRNPKHWTAVIATRTNVTNISEFALTAVPEVVSRFPETGFWEIEEKVVSGSRIREPRR